MPESAKATQVGNLSQRWNGSAPRRTPADTRIAPITIRMKSDRYQTSTGTSATAMIAAAVLILSAAWEDIISAFGSAQRPIIQRNAANPAKVRSGEGFGEGRLPSPPLTRIPRRALRKARRRLSSSWTTALIRRDHSGRPRPDQEHVAGLSRRHPAPRQRKAAQRRRADQLAALLGRLNRNEPRRRRAYRRGARAPSSVFSSPCGSSAAAWPASADSSVACAP